MKRQGFSWPVSEEEAITAVCPLTNVTATLAFKKWWGGGGGGQWQGGAGLLRLWWLFCENVNPLQWIRPSFLNKISYILHIYIYIYFFFSSSVNSLSLRYMDLTQDNLLSLPTTQSWTKSHWERWEAGRLRQQLSGDKAQAGLGSTELRGTGGCRPTRVTEPYPALWGGGSGSHSRFPIPYSFIF